MVGTEVFDIITPRYERLGDCIQCGACCISENCNQFVFREGKGVCLTQLNKPERCQIFPANPPIVFKSCGFWFWDRWEQRVIRAGGSL